jgi:hypothetical protein
LSTCCSIALLLTLPRLQISPRPSADDFSFPYHAPSKLPPEPTTDQDERSEEELISAWREIEGEDDNMLVKLERPRLREVFMHDLEGQTPNIRSIVSRHLCLKRHQQCTVAPRTAWLHGDFNVCIPISVSNWRSQRLMLRCPFPHMLGASHNSGPLDEKIRCEAATFAWISRHCETPIPSIWGFGLPGGLCVGRVGCFSYTAD